MLDPSSRNTLTLGRLRARTQQNLADIFEVVETQLQNAIDVRDDSVGVDDGIAEVSSIVRPWWEICRLILRSCAGPNFRRVQGKDNFQD